MNEMVVNKKIYEIFMGVKSHGGLMSTTIAGHATTMEGQNFYRVKLMMIPTVDYFLAKNPTSSKGFTLFSKQIMKNDKMRFQNPVGYALLSDDLKTHLEIYLPLFVRSVFMSLYPKHL